LNSRRENRTNLTLNKNTARVHLTTMQSKYVQLLVSGINSVTNSRSGNTLKGINHTIYRCVFTSVTFEPTPLPKQNFHPLTLYNISLCTFTGTLTVGRFVTKPTRVSIRTGKSHNTAVISCVSCTYKPPPPPYTDSSIEFHDLGRYWAVSIYQKLITLYCCDLPNRFHIFGFSMMAVYGACHGFRWLVVGLSPRRLWFYPRSVRGRFVMGRVTLWQVFHRVLRISSITVIQPVLLSFSILLHSFIHPSLTVYNLSIWQRRKINTLKNNSICSTFTKNY